MLKCFEASFPLSLDSVNFTEKKNMIQRIQTVYFAIAMLLIAFPIVLSEFFTISFGVDQLESTPFEIRNITTNEVLTPSYAWVLMLIILVLLFLTIFSYKNRKRQLQIGWIAFTLHLLSVAWVLFEVIRFTQFQSKQDASFSMEMGFFCFASAFLFIFFGIKGIRKDKALIDSLNRLR